MRHLSVAEQRIKLLNGRPSTILHPLVVPYHNLQAIDLSKYVHNYAHTNDTLAKVPHKAPPSGSEHFKTNTLLPYTNGGNRGVRVQETARMTQCWRLGNAERALASVSVTLRYREPYASQTECGQRNGSQTKVSLCFFPHAPVSMYTSTLTWLDMGTRWYWIFPS